VLFTLLRPCAWRVVAHKAAIQPGGNG